VNFDEEKLEELTESIRTYGVLSPILVRPGKNPGKYIVIAGERRFRAAGRAGLTSIPAIVDSEQDETGERTLAIQLVENIQRAELTPLERAHAIGALKESFSLSIRDVAKRLGISKSMVQRSIDILDLPDDLLNALRQGASESKILTIARIEDAGERARLLNSIEDFSRDELNERVVKKSAPKGKTKGKAAKQQSPEDMRIAEEIQRALGMKVALIRQGASSESGKISIEFYSDEDLQEVFRKLVAN
jgi:ParB family chromosome partitioning protein